MHFDFPHRHAHELILFFYPSPGLDWRTPRSLAWTTARNRLLGRPRGIGHATILIHSPKRTVLTGMTQACRAEGRKEILWDGVGMGILFHNFQGALERAEKLIPELYLRSQKPGRLSYLRVRTNEAISARLFSYLEEYERNGYAKWYGMRNRPLHGEGSGCSAFAASFLEVAGNLHEDYEREWTRTFNIPKRWVGGQDTGRKVSFLRILWEASQWAHESEPHEKGFFWDPDLMHAWILKQHGADSRASALTSPAINETWRKAPGVAIDASHFPAPTGKIFKHVP